MTKQEQTLFKLSMDIIRYHQIKVNQQILCQEEYLLSILKQYCDIRSQYEAQYCLPINEMTNITVKENSILFEMMDCSVVSCEVPLGYFLSPEENFRLLKDRLEQEMDYND